MAEAQSEIIAYHDETAQTGPNGNLSGHILYFVPRRLRKYNAQSTLFNQLETEYNPQAVLLERINNVLKEADLSHHKFHFTTRTGTKWTEYAETYRRFIKIGVDSLRHKNPKYLPKPAHCKMAVMFYPSGTDVSIFGGEGKERYLRHDETIIRWLLKGALHRLYDTDHEVKVVGIVSDGHPDHRDLDDWRILERMQYDDGPRTSDLRDYVSIAKVAQIIHLSSDPEKHEGGRSLEHCRMLQLADLLFGAVRRSHFKDIRGCSDAPRVGERLRQWKKKDVLSVPVRRMLDKRNRGAGFKHSGHFSTFTVSKVEFSESGPEFTEIDLELDERTSSTLFDD